MGCPYSALSGMGVVTVRVRSPRWISRRTSPWTAAFLRASDISRQWATDLPFTATTRSPTSRPARCAGNPSIRVPILVSSMFMTPCPQRKTAVSRKASRTLKRDPSSRIRKRFQADCSLKPMPGVTTSPSDSSPIPASRQEPPTGKSRQDQSSPFRSNCLTTGPMPKANSCTCTPRRRAVM